MRLAACRRNSATGQMSEQRLITIWNGEGMIGRAAAATINPAF